MENKTFTHTENLASTTSNSFVLSPILNTTVTTPTLQTLQSVPQHQSTIIDSDKTKNNTNKGSTRSLIQATYPIKQEHSNNTSYQEGYPIARNLLTSNQSKKTNSFLSTITPLQLNPRESFHPLTAISMANLNGHIMSALNPVHLPENSGGYMFSNLPNDLVSNYKLPRSSNTDVPSPSNSSNSSNPSSSHHQTKRREEGGDPTRKRAVRLQKNRDAARECRRKKKEYIKCLEERVTGLETQNKALIDELRQLKELYCQRDDNNKPIPNPR